MSESRSSRDSGAPLAPPEASPSPSGSPELAEVVATLAHQIRNPLGSITNATYLLRQVLEADASSDVARALEIVHEEAWRANRIITELMDYARPKPTRRQTVELGELVGAELDTLEVPSSVQVVRGDCESHSVHADPDQTRRILHHLLRNAIEAMPDGGELSIDVRGDGDHVVLEIENSGTGIAPEDRERIFWALQSNKPDGLGLGLATARELARRQGATLTCTSTSSPVRFELRFGAESDAPE